jgi:putative salt-induced outer membrane protein YdiY
MRTIRAWKDLRMLRLAVGATAVLALLSLHSVPAAADEVVLADGTKIIGTVTNLSGTTLTVEGGAAGKVQFPFSSVRSVTTDGSHTVVLADGRTVRGRLVLGAGGAPELAIEGGASEPLAYGQITEIDPPEKKAVEYTGNISLSGKVTDGNTNTDSAATAAEIIRRTEKDRLTLFGDWNYSEDDGRVTQRNASGRGKYDYFFSEKLFGYANGSLEGDDFADLDLRSTAGVGAGHQFFDDATLKYSEEVGISYVDENFQHGAHDSYSASRLSGQVDWVVRPDRVSFFHFHELLWSLDDVDDALVDTRTGFRFTLIAKFFALLQVNYKWDNTPAPGRERDDTEYMVGLGYSFGF